MVFAGPEPDGRGAKSGAGKRQVGGGVKGRRGKSGLWAELGQSWGTQSEGSKQLGVRMAGKLGKGPGRDYAFLFRTLQRGDA